MDKLFDISNNLIRNTKSNFQRYLLTEINWENRLIAIKGARGVGKTTLLLQRIKQSHSTGREVIYVNLDDLFFTGHSLADFANEFVQNGGRFLYLDEVHKYPNWSQEIKNIYDHYQELKIVFTSSSLLHVYKGFADLSRRAVSYDLNGLSFREYLDFEYGKKYQPVSLADILKSHMEIVQPVLADIKPIAEFKSYQSNGFYPFFKESKTDYYQKIRQVINLVLESDLPSVAKIDYSSILKIKKLLYIIATSAPFIPNILKLSELTGSGRLAIIQYLEYLKDAGILNLLKSEEKGMKYLAKPEKIYLNNSDLMFALASENTNTGNLRETFFFNQLNTVAKVTYTKFGDFKVDDSYIFEIGGKNKDFSQIRNIQNSYLVLDNIEGGLNNKIPLWVFGFLY
jgi:predicted AAA+ superfamily ATPase